MIIENIEVKFMKLNELLMYIPFYQKLILVDSSRISLTESTFKENINE